MKFHQTGSVFLGQVLGIFSITVYKPFVYVLMKGNHSDFAPLGWICRIHRLHLWRGVRHNGCHGYDTKQSDGEAPVMLELWKIRSTPSLSLLPVPLWPGVLAPDRVLSMGQIELFDIYELFEIKRFLHLTLCKQIIVFR